MHVILQRGKRYVAQIFFLNVRHLAADALHRRLHRQSIEPMGVMGTAHRRRGHYEEVPSAVEFEDGGGSE